MPWGLVALLIGRTAGRRRRAAVDAGIYGFALSFVIMAAGYSGAAPLTGRLWFFVLLGLFGAACGGFVAVIGKQVRSWLKLGVHADGVAGRARRPVTAGGPGQSEYVGLLVTLGLGRYRGTGMGFMEGHKARALTKGTRLR